MVVENNEGITSFSVPEQTEEAKINGAAITVSVPYGYDTTKVVPTFELADGVLALTKGDTLMTRTLLPAARLRSI